MKDGERYVDVCGIETLIKSIENPVICEEDGNGNRICMGVLIESGVDAYRRHWCQSQRHVRTFPFVNSNGWEAVETKNFENHRFGEAVGNDF